MELDEKQLKATVRESLRELLAEQRLMPVPAPVTEIVIRCGSPEAVQVLGGRISAFTTCCPDFATAGMEPMPLDDRSKELLQRIKDKTGEAPKKVIRKLEHEIRAQQLAEAIEKYAKELGVE